MFLLPIQTQRIQESYVQNCMVAGFSFSCPVDFSVTLHQCTAWNCGYLTSFSLDPLVLFIWFLHIEMSSWYLYFVDKFFLFSFSSVIVDPTNLSDGLHYYEIYGIDCKAPWRGPLFRIPVTITKPMAVKSQPPIVSFSKMTFMPGDFPGTKYHVQIIYYNNAC